MRDRWTTQSSQDPTTSPNRSDWPGSRRDKEREEKGIREKGRRGGSIACWKRDSKLRLEAPWHRTPESTKIITGNQTSYLKHIGLTVWLSPM